MSRGRSLPYVCLAGPMFTWRLCRSCTTTHSCAKSGSGPPSWASCILLLCLEAPVWWGNGQGTLCVLALRGPLVRVYYMKQQQLVATHQRRYSGIFSAEILSRAAKVGWCWAFAGLESKMPANVCPWYQKAGLGALKIPQSRPVLKPKVGPKKVSPLTKPAMVPFKGSIGGP